MQTKKAATKSNGNGLKASINATTKDTTIKSKSTLPEEKAVLQLTPVEKKIIRHRIKTNPAESKLLLAVLDLISERSVLYYKFQEEDAVPVTLRVHAFMDNRYNGILNYLNHQSFFVLCDYDGRLWKCKNFREVALLRKALRKDLPLRYPGMTWIGR
jgi:hypothetical protein